MQVDLGDLRFEEGGRLLVSRALRGLASQQELAVTGDSPELEIHLAAWCRAQGHGFRWEAGRGVIVRGNSEESRWMFAERAGDEDRVVDHAPRRWGLAARGATVEAGAPEFAFHIVHKIDVWADAAPRIYAQAAASQWDPQTAIPWETPFELPGEVEDAVVQIMTYLIENETAALIVPSRFLAQLHPHFREVMQVLAVQAADEARHIEVFTRRALLKRSALGLSTVGGQTSLKTLVDEPHFAVASFLLSVLGEGSFLSLLWFLEKYAPDPVTAAVARLAAQDEARHRHNEHQQRAHGVALDQVRVTHGVLDREHRGARHAVLLQHAECHSIGGLRLEPVGDDLLQHLDMTCPPGTVGKARIV